MKISTLIFVFLVLVLQTLNGQSDLDVLMSVGDADVTVGEFRYIYEKNNGEKADYSEESLSEYLDLYKKFKLKVQEAKSMQLDTISALQTELAGYRKQLAGSFLSDREIIDEVIDEIFERKKEDVELSHLLISIKPTAPDADKADAERRIELYKKEIEGGRVFGAVAGQYSEDKNSSRQRGYLGYTTAMLPTGLYEFENAIYKAEPGDIVGPVWSKLGCHLIEVKSKRPARGVIKVAHILVKPTTEGTKSLRTAETKADSIYSALQQGADWNTLVKRHSDDTKTVKQNGELPIFGISTYESAFEDASFELLRPGDYSKPVKTRSGYHIIKLVQKLAPETKEEIKKRLKDKIKKYDRYEAAEARLIEDIKERSNYTENQGALAAFANSLTPEFYSYKWKPDNVVKDDLFSIDGKNITTVDFGEYCKQNPRIRSQFEKSKPIPEAVRDIYELFVKESVMNYEQATLEEKYPAFKSLMREYEEGILLFEATKIAVWDKANQDTVGLKAFYDQNKGNYVYDRRATIGRYIVKTDDPKVLKAVHKCAKKHSAEKTLKRFNKEGNEIVEYSETSVPLDDPIFTNVKSVKNEITPLERDPGSGSSTFSKVISIAEPRIKTLKEARGYVVADYQDQLEQNWVQELQGRYSIKLNAEVYKSLIK